MYFALVTKNQKGSLAVQFLFGWVLVMIFGVIFGALSLTLMMSEVVQFVTYVSARSYFLGEGSERNHIAVATKKYADLTSDMPLLKTGGDSWFSVGPEITRTLGFNESITPSHANQNLFVGVWTNFSAKGLFKSIPLPLWSAGGAGSLSDDDTSENFTATIGSYLGREPSREDCQKFDAQRWKWIYQIQRSTTPSPAISAVRPIALPFSGDNDC